MEDSKELEDVYRNMIINESTDAFIPVYRIIFMTLLMRTREPQYSSIMLADKRFTFSISMEVF